MPRSLTTEQISEFQDNGYLIVPKLFDVEEAKILHVAAKADKALSEHAYDLEDGEGGKAQLVLWNKAGEDLWGAIARSERIVDAMEALLGDEVYHYHSKMSIKRPRTGGAWSWHQDYGYWYQNGCLFPDMASAFIAIDPNTKANGCLQVLRGSHKMPTLTVSMLQKKIWKSSMWKSNLEILFFSTATPYTAPTKTLQSIQDGLYCAVTIQSTIILIKNHITLSMNQLKKCRIMQLKKWEQNYLKAVQNFGIQLKMKQLETIKSNFLTLYL